MARERTFIMVKPDGVQRRLIGKVLTRFEKKGLKCVALKMLKLSQERAEEHYSIHKGKPFYKDLINFITSGPVVVMVWEGENAIYIVRKVVGATSPEQAEPGTIRGDYVIDTGNNIVHASDASDTAEREINLFFEDDEIMIYDLTIDCWLGDGG